MYDGTLGVVGAVAAIKALQEAGFKPQKPIEALFFTSEEPTRFGLGCIGRSALLLLLLLLPQNLPAQYLVCNTHPPQLAEVHPDCMCSRGMCGALKPADLDRQLDINGTSFAQAANKAGYGGKDHKVGQDRLAAVKLSG